MKRPPPRGEAAQDATCGNTHPSASPNDNPARRSAAFRRAMAAAKTVRLVPTWHDKCALVRSWRDHITSYLQT